MPVERAKVSRTKQTGAQKKNDEKPEADAAKQAKEGKAPRRAKSNSKPESGSQGKQSQSAQAQTYFDYEGPSNAEKMNVTDFLVSNSTAKSSQPPPEDSNAKGSLNPFELLAHFFTPLRQTSSEASPEDVQKGFELMDEKINERHKVNFTQSYRSPASLIEQAPQYDGSFDNGTGTTHGPGEILAKTELIRPEAPPGSNFTDSGSRESWKLMQNGDDVWVRQETTPNVPLWELRTPVYVGPAAPKMTQDKVNQAINDSRKSESPNGQLLGTMLQEIGNWNQNVSQPQFDSFNKTLGEMDKNGLAVENYWFDGDSIVLDAMRPEQSGNQTTGFTSQRFIIYQNGGIHSSIDGANLNPNPPSK